MQLVIHKLVITERVEVKIHVKFANSMYNKYKL